MLCNFGVMGCNHKKWGALKKIVEVLKLTFFKVTPPYCQ